MADKVDWQEIAQCYEKGAANVATICRTFGVSRSTFYRRRKEHGWQRMSQPNAALLTQPTVRSIRGNSRRSGDHNAAAPDLAERRDLVRRLFAAWEQRLGMIEHQIAEDGGSTEVVSMEKQARSLSLLVRDFEKLSGIYDQLIGQGSDRISQGVATEPDTGAEADAWREALARRLERLCQAQCP